MKIDWSMLLVGLGSIGLGLICLFKQFYIGRLFVYEFHGLLFYIIWMALGLYLLPKSFVNKSK